MSARVPSAEEYSRPAKALIDSNPNPTLKDIHHGLSGNLCRCGTYAGMRQAVLAAAAEDAADTKKGKTKGDGEPPKEPKGVAHG